MSYRRIINYMTNKIHQKMKALTRGAKIIQSPEPTIANKSALKEDKNQNPICSAYNSNVIRQEAQSKPNKKTKTIAIIVKKSKKQRKKASKKEKSDVDKSKQDRLRNKIAKQKVEIEGLRAKVDELQKQERKRNAQEALAKESREEMYKNKVASLKTEEERQRNLREKSHQRRINELHKAKAASESKWNSSKKRLEGNESLSQRRDRANEDRPSIRTCRAQRSGREDALEGASVRDAK